MTQCGRSGIGCFPPWNRINVSRTLLILTVLGVAACGPIPQVDVRAQYWAGEANSFFDEQRTMQEVHSWLRSNNVIYTFEESDIVDGHWTMTLEKVYLDGWRCEWIDIQINVSVNDSLAIQGHDLAQKRSCWW